MRIITRHSLEACGRAAILAVLSLMLALPACAQQPPEVAPAPLRFLWSSAVKPNLYFMLDDSASMQWSFLGDEVLAHGYENAIGYRSSACNKIYYNPAITYPVPVDSRGQPFPAQDFHAALYDGFQAGSVKVDLSTGFMPWRSRFTQPPVPASTDGLRYAQDCWGESRDCVTDGGLPNRPEPAHYFVYRGDKPERLGDNSADDHCKDHRYDTDAAASHRWTKILVGSRSGPAGSDERQNFANWFSYHRTRILTMKTAVGRAFSQFDARLRVGYSVISEPGTDAGLAGFLKIRDFDAVQRSAFYDKLYSVHPTSSTPLRAALSKAGRLYAGKLLTGADDPVRYACQQNFALLSTDGYWNTTDESASYGPRRIDGSTPVGNQDHLLPRPMFDGGHAGTEVRVSTLTIVLTPSPDNATFTGVRNITVNGKGIMGRTASVAHAAGGDLMGEASLLARRIAAAITLSGYRAFAELNQVTIIAPASAGAVASLPMVSAVGLLPMTASPFAPPAGAAPRTNTLADIAAYYANTDLRQPAFGNCGSDGSLCQNQQSGVSGKTGGGHQRMITHTLGLGANGTLRYRDDYDTAADGDFQAIIRGTLDWPDPIFFPGAERVDDLWHAAVNGGGRYFNARSPEALARALSSAMSAINAATGAASSVATSSQQPISGEDFLFASRYRTVFWDGDVEAGRIRWDKGRVSIEPVWSAAAELDRLSGPDHDQRRILVAAPGTPRGLKELRWSLLDADERAGFGGLCGAGSGRTLSQCASLTELQRAALTGENLLGYLRGQRGAEDQPGNALRLFRRREHVLGAPIHATPLHVAAPPFRYIDDHYGEFRHLLASTRKPMLYVAANDGMLHAFDARNGSERWAFIPPASLRELWRSADLKWATDFRYLLDGSPVAGDICAAAPAAACQASEWRTILVGGMGAAGRAYYALDITQPDEPALLWHIDATREPDLGLALGKPVITKRGDGRWVVLLSSGYANVNPGSGRGIVFVLDAFTGAVLSRIDTGAGSTARPAGLAQLNAWIDSTLDNRASRVYGGDLLGNVWRIDINDPPQAPPVLLAQLDHGGREQPVTTRPELSVHRVGNRDIPLVTVATGRLLGAADAADTSVQSIYTFRDDSGGSGLGRLQGSARMVRQQLSDAGEGERTVSTQAVDWTRDDGWILNLDAQPLSGERVTIDPEQQLGILRVISNVPDPSPCQPRAQGWVYHVELSSGAWLPLEGRQVAGRRVARHDMISGARTVWIDGKSTAVLSDEAGRVTPIDGVAPATTGNTVRRVSWRELD